MSLAITRRDFLAAATLPRLKFDTQSCIVLKLTGGPSHLDTWDPKPDAPSDIRGPFRPIRTNVPGIEISEIFPRLARHADKYAIVRSVFHDATTHAEAQALFNFDTATTIDLTWDLAWDTHGWQPFSPISHYRDLAGPRFDAAFSTLLEDLSQRGRLETTLVVALGEFGRTPKINPDGGRDHWPHCFSILLAGGGIQGGQVYGSSDRIGTEPRDNPVTPAMLSATIRKAMGTAPAPGDQPLDELLRLS